MAVNLFTPSRKKIHLHVLNFLVDTLDRVILCGTKADAVTHEAFVKKWRNIVAPEIETSLGGLVAFNNVYFRCFFQSAVNILPSP